MATAGEQVAASQQRQRIPTEWQVEFQTWTSESLLSLSEDEIVQPKVRAYASWELDYRIAFGIHVDEPPAPSLEGKGFVQEVLTTRTKGITA